jgi:hypothetical protein
VTNQRSHKYYIKRFSQKLNEIKGKVQYFVEVSHRFTVLEDLDAEMDINSYWEAIREYRLL